ncbi:hypothetical protein M501DRAFT_138323 [Patellaria atrata CBS 101060]|uniref:Uncharacterized protein n=1 Tax=Patellaria atrata CBS 101060 TaxID=1346257 RepID=A0A9P4S9J3_9PEZI|nr:hypothetical protein M501DRAFT_138323 [Patellaria atrata CBS 101060]
MLDGCQQPKQNILDTPHLPGLAPTPSLHLTLHHLTTNFSSLPTQHLYLTASPRILPAQLSSTSLRIFGSFIPSLAILIARPVFPRHRPPGENHSFKRPVASRLTLYSSSAATGRDEQQSAFLAFAYSLLFGFLRLRFAEFQLHAFDVEEDHRPCPVSSSPVLSTATHAEHLKLYDLAQTNNENTQDIEAPFIPAISVRNVVLRSTSRSAWFPLSGFYNAVLDPLGLSRTHIFNRILLEHL